MGAGLPAGNEWRRRAPVGEVMTMTTFGGPIFCNETLPRGGACMAVGALYQVPLDDGTGRWVTQARCTMHVPQGGVLTRSTAEETPDGAHASTDADTSSVVTPDDRENIIQRGTRLRRRKDGKFVVDPDGDYEAIEDAIEHDGDVRPRGFVVPRGAIAETRFASLTVGVRPDPTIDPVGLALREGHADAETPDLGSRAWMADLMEQVFDECRALRGAGQKEYAHEEDNAFGNFDRVGREEGVEPERVLMIYFRKHLDGIRAHLAGHVSQREPVEGRINDAIVYLCLLRGLIERRRVREQGEARARGILKAAGWLDDGRGSL